MGDRKHQPIKKLAQNEKGEMLVETIVSFVIFLIALVAITALIRSATAMNGKAAEKSGKIEDAAVKVEQSQSDAAPGKGTMAIEFADGAKAALAIDIKAADPFVYFEPSSGGGGQ